MHTHNTLGVGTPAPDDELDLRTDDVVFMASPIGHITALLAGGPSARDVRDDHRVAGRLEPRGRRGPDRPRGLHVHVLGDAVPPRAGARAQRQPRHAADVPAVRLRRGARCRASWSAAPRTSTASTSPPCYGSSEALVVSATTLTDAARTLRRGRPRAPGGRGAPGGSETGAPLRRARRASSRYRTGGAVRRLLPRPRAHRARSEPRPLVQHRRPLHAGRGGYVNVVGRKKDMIIRGGANISAREIEELLFTHPKVRAWRASRCRTPCSSSACARSLCARPATPRASRRWSRSSGPSASRPGSSPSAWRCARPCR